MIIGDKKFCDVGDHDIQQNDEFFKFVVQGVAQKSYPKKLAQLVVCRTHRSAMLLAKKISDPTVLPQGRLRRVLEKIQSRAIRKALSIH